MEDYTALMEQIRKLEAENLNLKQKAEEEVLPTFTEYDRNLLLTVEDAAELLSLSTVEKLSTVDIRSIVRLFNMEPNAQYRPDLSRKGRGTHLYLKGDFEAVLEQIENNAG